MGWSMTSAGPRTTGPAVGRALNPRSTLYSTEATSDWQLGTAPRSPNHLTPDIPESAPTVTTKKGSPWSGLGRGLTNEEWVKLKEWKKENKLLVFKRREARGDGKIFWGYDRRYRGGEKWVSIETSRKLDEVNKSEKRTQYVNSWRNRKYKTNKEYRESKKTQSKEYRKNNKEKANESRNKWWRKRYSSDSTFRRKSLDKCLERKKRLGSYCAGTALRRVDEITGDLFLIKRIYRHAALSKRRNGIRVEVDHIIPIRHGGQHHEKNLQILPEEMNRIKKDNPFWMHDGCYLDWRNVPRFLWPEHLKPEYERLILLHPKPVHAIHRKLCHAPSK